MQNYAGKPTWQLGPPGPPISGALTNPPHRATSLDFIDLLMGYRMGGENEQFTRRAIELLEEAEG